MTDEQRKNELKPCPFTHVDKDFGHSAWIGKNEHDLWWIGCNCGYRGPVMATPEQAVRAHNELLDLRNARSEHTEAMRDAVGLIEVLDINGKVVFDFICDYCGKRRREVYEFNDSDGYQTCDSSDFYERMKAKAKESGWLIGWPEEDICDDCRLNKHNIG